jgi:hypothetical protein
MKNIFISLILILSTATASALSLKCTPLDGSRPTIEINDLNQSIDSYTNRYRVIYNDLQLFGYGIVDEGRLGLSVYELSEDNQEYFSAIISGYPRDNSTYLMNFRFQAQSAPDEYSCIRFSP